MALSAVGNKNLQVTACDAIKVKARTELERPAQATMGRPKYSVGSRSCISPAVQARSAELQNTASEWVLRTPSKPN